MIYSVMFRLGQYSFRILVHNRFLITLLCFFSGATDQFTQFEIQQRELRPPVRYKITLSVVMSQYVYLSAFRATICSFEISCISIAILMCFSFCLSVLLRREHKIPVLRPSRAIDQAIGQLVSLIYGRGTRVPRELNNQILSASKVLFGTFPPRAHVIFFQISYYSCIILVFASSSCFTLAVPMREVYCVGPCTWNPRSSQFILNGPFYFGHLESCSVAWKRISLD